MTIVAMLRGKNILVDGSSFAMEFFLNVFTEFNSVTKKYLSLKGLEPATLVQETKMLPQSQQDTCERGSLNRARFMLQ